MRNSIHAAIAAAAAALATAAPAAATDFSARYSAAMAVSGGFAHGFQASFGMGGPGLALVADGGLVSADEGAVLVTAGPRWSSRPDRDGTSVFVQLLGGFVLSGGSQFFVNPGVGVDFRTDRNLGFRIQVEGPVVTTGGVYDFMRVSAGIVLRPEHRR